MLYNIGDIQEEFLIRNNRTTTDAFITDTILNDWVREAHRWVAGYKKWPFTEGKINTTYVVDASLEVGFNYPEGWKPDSIRLLQVGGKRFKKTNFYKYQEFREDNPQSKEKLFSDHGRLYYINPNADVAGTTTLWGQFNPQIDPTDKTATTVFSDVDEAGNEAMVEKMTVFLKGREHLIAEMELQDKRVRAILDEIWKQVADEQFAYQDVQGEGMFKRFDILKGALSDEIIKRDRFY